MALFGSAFEKLGGRVVESLFLGLIEDFGPEDVDEAVEENINLLELTSKERPRVLATSERLARQFKSYSKYLTFDNVMLWLKKRRPKLYNHIEQNPEARSWLKGQVKAIRHFFFG